MARFVDWLREHARALASRLATASLRRRMRRAQAQLSPQARAEAAFWRARYLARETRLQRERAEREMLRGSREPRGSNGISETPARTIDKAEVLAAIARGRARRHGRANETTGDGNTP